jgi:hypothetical protein
MWGKKRSVVVSSTISWEDLIAIVDALFGLKEEGKRVQALDRMGALSLRNKTDWMNFLDVYNFHDDEVRTVDYIGVEVEPIPEVEEEEASVPPPPEEAAGDTDSPPSEDCHVEEILYDHSSSEDGVEEEEEEESKDVKWEIPEEEESKDVHWGIPEEDVCTSCGKERKPPEGIQTEPSRICSEDAKEVCKHNPPQCVYFWKPPEDAQLELERQIETLTLKFERMERKLDRCTEELIRMNSKPNPKPKPKPRREKHETVRSITEAVYHEMVGRKFTADPEWYTKEWIRSSAKRYLKRKCLGRLPPGFIDKIIEYGLEDGLFNRKVCIGTYLYQKAERY